MNNLKCPNCGADIATDEAQKSGKCPYCNSRFAAEKKEEPKPTPDLSNIFSNIETPMVRVNPNKRRPKLRLGLLILFLMCGPIFFFGYILIVEMKKREWDKQNR